MEVDDDRLHNNMSADLDVIASKNWLVKNNKWCFIIGRKTDKLDEYGDYVREYVVMDEDGTVLCNRQDLFPNETVGGWLCYTLSEIRWGEPYAMVCWEDENDENYVEYYSIYRFTGELNGNGIKSVKVNEIKGYPNPLRNGESFRVELDRPADDNTIIVVTDMKGRQVERRHIEEGAYTTTLRRAHFGSGQYIYTVIFGDGTSATGKVLAE